MTARKTKAGTPISAAIAHALAPDPPEAPDDDPATAPALAVGPPAAELPIVSAEPSAARSAVTPGCPGRPASAPGSPDDSTMGVSPATSPTGGGRVSRPRRWSGRCRPLVAT